MGQERLDIEEVKRSILAVEDDPEIRGMIARLFQAKGYRVLEAENARRALEILDSEPVGVLLLDKNLPGEQSGIDVLREAPARAPYAKSIIVTAYASTDSAVDALRLGAFDYIRKPFKMEEIVEKVERAFETLALDYEQEALMKRHSTLFETIPGVVWFSTDNGVFRRVNHTGADLLGFTPQELLGQSYEVLLPEQTLDPAIHWAFKERRTGDRTTRNLRVELKTARGGLRTFEVFSSGVYVTAEIQGRQVKRPCGTVGVAYDVTERIRLQDELQQVQKMEAIGTLAGGVAHEMNNILTVVLGLGSLLEAEMPSDDARSQDIEDILSAARRGRALTQNLLDYARTGKHRKERVSLNSVVEKVTGVLQRTVSKKIDIRTTLDDQLAECECDSSQMTQVLMNLCLNAVDAMGDSGVLTMTTRNVLLSEDEVVAIPDFRPGQYLKLEVVDSGVGMDDETLRRVFEPFFTTKEVGKGTGLGLSVVYGMVKNHNGTVTVDSEVGEGTTVTVLLPALQPLDSVEGAEASEQQPRRGEGMILLVDDEKMIRSAGKRTLEHLGYEVLLASDGQSALKVFSDNRESISLVLLDLAMPTMDGRECLDRLLEIDSGVRVLICTGHSSGRRTEDLREKGALGVINKPFDLQQLGKAIADVLV